MTVLSRAVLTMLFLWVKVRIDHKLEWFDIAVKQADFGVRRSRVLHAGAALFTRHVGAHHVGVHQLVHATHFVHAGGVDLKPAFGVSCAAQTPCRARR